MQIPRVVFDYFQHASHTDRDTLYDIYHPKHTGRVLYYIRCLFHSPKEIEKFPEQVVWNSWLCLDIEKNTKNVLKYNRLGPLNRSSLDKRTFEIAAKLGNLGIMKLLRKSGCPWDKWTFMYAAIHGNLENMKWLRENNCPWGSDTFEFSALYGNLENMKWLKANGCPWDEFTFRCAAEHGNLENMKWLKKAGCEWNHWTFEDAVKHNNQEIIEWLKANGCPEF